MKPSKTRRQIAWEAARLINEQSDLRHSDARRSAVERLFPDGVRPRDLPTNQEVGEQLRSIIRELKPQNWENRFEIYSDLLSRLADVKQDPQSHPEGDALYHSLQVFQLVEQQYHYDEELLTAALLHDVGKGIDRRDPVAATLAAIEGIVTERTRWFIEHLPSAREYLAGSLGQRARSRLEAAEDFDELLALANCDIQGRICGMPVPDYLDAIAMLRMLSSAHDEQ